MKITNENFIMELKRKNPQAMDFIVDSYGSLLKSVLIRNLYFCKEKWEECFNDVLLAMWNNPDRFDDKQGDFKNWICAIAKYKAIDTLRIEIRYKGNQESIEWFNTIYASENGVEITDDSLDELEKLLNCLSEEDKDLFFRRYVDEQSIDEIAEEKNMNRNQIYKRISRGKKKIRKNV